MHWLLLSNETLGDTLLSLRFFAAWRHQSACPAVFTRLSLLVPQHFAGISSLFPNLPVHEYFSVEKLENQGFDEVIDLSHADNFVERTAHFHAPVKRGFDVRAASSEEYVRHFDSTGGLLWQKPLEDAYAPLDQLSRQNVRFEEAWLSDCALFPELKADAWTAMLKADAQWQAIRQERRTQVVNTRRILLLPGGKFADKRLPENYWLKLARHCQHLGLGCTLVLGPNERQIGFGTLLSSLCDVVEPNTIDELLDLMESHSLGIAHDCGQMHIACQAGLPTVALFSITNPVVWFPYGQPPHIALGGWTPAGGRILPDSREACTAVERLYEETIQSGEGKATHRLG